MKYIVVLDPDAPTWEVLRTFNFSECPSSPVKYRYIDPKIPVDIIETCDPVDTIHEVTGASGQGTPIKINES